MALSQSGQPSQPIELAKPKAICLKLFIYWQAHEKLKPFEAISRLQISPTIPYERI
jgi:hypothetical protein